MLGRDRHRVAEAEPVGLADAGKGCATLGLVGDEHNRFTAAPQPIGKMTVGYGDPLTRVDDEESYVRRAERPLGLLLHPTRK